MRVISSLQELANVPFRQRFDWYIPEGISTAYPIKENGEPLVDLRRVAVESGVPLVFAEIAKRYFLRQSVAERLMRACRGIVTDSEGVRTVKVYDSFRPLQLQRQLFEQIKAEIAEKEQLEGKPLWERVTQFIADPDLCPPHSTGGAIDCTLVEVHSGMEVDMGTPIDTIGDAAATMYSGITETQKTNRLELFSHMIDTGFANLASEWWHYSFGDQYWAIFYGHPQAIFASREQAPAP